MSYTCLRIAAFFGLIFCSCGSGTMDLSSKDVQLDCSSPEGVYPRVVVTMSMPPPCPSVKNPLADYQTGSTLCDANGCYFQSFPLVCSCGPVPQGW
jgi:hypothetical protein